MYKGSKGQIHGPTTINTKLQWKQCKRRATNTRQCFVMPQMKTLSSYEFQSTGHENPPHGTGTGTGTSITVWHLLHAAWCLGHGITHSSDCHCRSSFSIEGVSDQFTWVMMYNVVLRMGCVTHCTVSTAYGIVISVYSCSDDGCRIREKNWNRT